MCEFVESAQTVYTTLHKVSMNIRSRSLSRLYHTLHWLEYSVYSVIFLWLHKMGGEIIKKKLRKKDDTVSISCGCGGGGGAGGSRGSSGNGADADGEDCGKARLPCTFNEEYLLSYQ